jgi:integrase
MARTAEGWKIIWKRGVAHVRFRLQGQRQQISTRSKDPVEASQVAARVYADFVSGAARRTSSGSLVHPSTPMDEVCADWIADIMPELGENTDTTYQVYARHWCEHFKTMGTVVTPAIGAYQRARLGHVQRSTVVKERGALRRFLTWCVEKGTMRDVPDFPPLPKKAAGKQHRQGRRKPKVELSVAEVEAILAALPVMSERSRRGHRFHMRAYYEFCYETGLRPEGTVDRLLGKDVSGSGLHIRPECDKNRWERVVPLSAGARRAVASLGKLEPERPLFGVHDRRVQFRKACILALGPERGPLTTPYDLKHARATALVDAGASATGITFLTGTKSALDRYVHPNRRAAEAAIGCLTGAASSETQCEGGDLNPDESNLASTSSKFCITNGPYSRQFENSDDPDSAAQTILSGARHPIGATAESDELVTAQSIAEDSEAVEPAVEDSLHRPEVLSLGFAYLAARRGQLLRKCSAAAGPAGLIDADEGEVRHG